jgi:hypothetical protein
MPPTNRRLSGDTEKPEGYLRLYEEACEPLLASRDVKDA